MTKKTNCHSERSEESKKRCGTFDNCIPVFTGMTKICHSERSEESKKRCGTFIKVSCPKKS